MRKLFNGGQFEAIVAVLSALATRYILDIIIARTSGSVAFGEYAVIMAYGLTLAMIASVGFPELANRQIPALHGEGRNQAIKSFLRLGLATGSTIGLIVGASAIAINSAAGPSQPSGDAVITLVILIPVIAIFNLRRQQSLLCGSTHTGLFSPALMSGLAAVIVLTGSLAFGRTGATISLLAVIASYLIVAALQRNGLARDRPPGRPATVSERLVWLRGGTVIVSSNLATVLTSQLDLLVVAHFASARDTGIYAAASRLAMLVTLALAGLETRVGPVFGHLFASGRRLECWKEYRRTCVISGAIGLVASGLLLLGGHVLLSLYGPKFVAGWGWLCVLVIGRFISAVTGPAALLLIVVDKSHSAAGASWAGLLLGAFMMVVLGLQVGPMGIAIGASSGMVVRNLMQAFLARRAFRDVRQWASS